MRKWGVRKLCKKFYLYNYKFWKKCLKVLKYKFKYKPEGLAMPLVYVIFVCIYNTYPAQIRNNHAFVYIYIYIYIYMFIHIYYIYSETATRAEVFFRKRYS